MDQSPFIDYADENSSHSSDYNSFGGRDSRIATGLVSRDRKHIYFLGIIDILQLYDCGKQAGMSLSNHQAILDVSYTIGVTY
jgi:hypothetical protein